MTASDLMRDAVREREHWQLHVSAFVDAFRAADPNTRARMIADGPSESGPLQGLVSAVVSSLCRETATPPPEWVLRIHSPKPFFAFPADSFALRLRLMLESPPAFRARNVFVPENYLTRV